jgi:hypothetical protein
MSVDGGGTWFDSRPFKSAPSPSEINTGLGRPPSFKHDPYTTLWNGNPDPIYGPGSSPPPTVKIEIIPPRIRPINPEELSPGPDVSALDEAIQQIELEELIDEVLGED